MDEIFRELGTLFLGSIPTMILFLILVFCYTALVDHPLRRTLARRREQTAGAQERAQAAIGEVEGKAREYGDRLRAARMEILQRRERQTAEWGAARDKAVGEARAAAAARVREARKAIEADAERSRAGLDPAIDALAAQVLQAVLPGAARAHREAASS